MAATKPLPLCLVQQSINGSIPCTGIVAVDSATGDPIKWRDLFGGNTLPATSQPLVGQVTASGVLASSGGANYASGTVYIGPFQAQLARDIRILLKGTWTGNFYIGTADYQDGCAPGKINPLTVAGFTWANYSANTNEVVDTPTVGRDPTNAPGPVYCAVAKVTTGTLEYALRQ
jgi:hypothetical protein